MKSSPQEKDWKESLTEGFLSMAQPCNSTAKRGEGGERGGEGEGKGEEVGEGEREEESLLRPSFSPDTSKRKEELSSTFWEEEEKRNRSRRGRKRGGKKELFRIGENFLRQVVAGESLVSLSAVSLLRLFFCFSKKE